MRIKTMIATVLSGALTVGFGGLALGAQTPVAGVAPQWPAFVRVAPVAAMQLAGHDKDEQGGPEGESYGPPQHGKHNGHGEKHDEHHQEEYQEHHEEHAEHHHHDKHHEEAEERERNYGGPFFRPAYAGYFHECYEGVDVKSLPPGLQKQVEHNGHLPPGLEKHLARNGKLPPGLQKRMSPANPCLLRRVGPLPVNSRLYMLGRDAYLINYHTHRILDILHGAY